MTDLIGRKPILCLDFDGTVSRYSGWKGAAVIPDPPVNGLFEFLDQAIREFEVNIFSSRSHQEGGLQAMKDWFDKHGTEWANGHTEPRTTFFLTQLKFPLEKPPAHVTLDDRGVLFTGTWPTMEFLKSFKPWYQKDREAYL